MNQTERYRMLRFDHDKAAFNLLYAQSWWRRAMAQIHWNRAMALTKMFVVSSAEDVRRVFHG